DGIRDRNVTGVQTCALPILVVDLRRLSMENIRKTDSKKRILKAFIEILSTDGFNKMTVSKITSLAHINRGTFYLNYIDKFDLPEEIEQEIFTKIKTILLEKETIDIIFADEKILGIHFLVWIEIPCQIFLYKKEDICCPLVIQSIHHKNHERRLNKCP